MTMKKTAFSSRRNYVSPTTLKQLADECTDEVMKWIPYSWAQLDRHLYYDEIYKYIKKARKQKITHNRNKYIKNLEEIRDKYMNHDCWLDNQE